ncbi:MAG: helix-turn-helix domain-containing protein [Clostridia bacterium]|nr:helix-turn-helix domain-containing protein [Clostridia bacterium]
MENFKNSIPVVIGWREAAKCAGVPANAVYQWIHSGQLPVVKCGRKLLVNMAVFNDFLTGKPLPDWDDKALLEKNELNDNGLYTSEIQPKKSKILSMPPIC